ncbi:MAG: lysophospholipid acyltransferase family protein [Shimia sp.]|uniref:lysophospholipid acyltransferase family protein n=1 Tax=Shimia sp. TaxID=1954381 RepID=UPI0019F74BE3|nr:lysophospholipid acyltransferase family protein [Shimia sp.]MBE1293262.1 lauroyl acyltransferase [Paracoccaceae bacterium]MBO6897273.1 lysophospholipid acyltransferase family protein [Shimia sp.]
MTHPSRRFGHWLTDLFARGFLGAMKAFPYHTRLNITGWVASNVLAPLTGNRARIRENLDLVMPELTLAEREAIVRQAPDNMGRSLMEMYSAKEALPRFFDAPIQGPGLDALLEAKENGTGAVIVTGHFGNYLALRGAMLGRGLPIGGLYKPMANPYFNAHYVAAMEDYGKPVFARGRRGMSNMVKHLRGGGLLGIILDQRINEAPVLSFMGKPARTALSAADLALKYGVPLVPAYGVRQPDDSFIIETEAPIPHTTSEEMTQMLNDSLEAQVRSHPGQWMWTHNRWRDAGNDTSEDRARGH